VSRDHPAVVVVGATGYTGRLVAAELAGGDAPYVLAARSPDRLERLASAMDGGVPQRVDVTDPDSLDRLIGPGDAVINTAGPFTELGEPVIRACIRAGAHYVDTTGEQPFMRDMWERHDGAARDAGVAVTPAMAFEYALGDGLVSVAAADRPTPLRSVDVIYAWGGVASSRGTRRTALRMMGRKAWTREDGTERLRPPASSRRTVTMGSGRTVSAVAFGSGEVLTVPRRLDVDTVRGWLVMGSRTARVAPIVAPVLPWVLPLVRPLLEPFVTRRPDPTPAKRDSSAFTIRVEIVDAAGESTAHELEGHDPYGITAVVAALGARRALAGGAPAGVLAPSRMVEPRILFSALKARGLIRDPVPVAT
jgi:short subunit dehydrogenase-like uncharacterized protein